MVSLLDVLSFSCLIGSFGVIWAHNGPSQLLGGSVSLCIRLCSGSTGVMGFGVIWWIRSDRWIQLHNNWGWLVRCQSVLLVGYKVAKGKLFLSFATIWVDRCAIHHFTNGKVGVFWD